MTVIAKAGSLLSIESGCYSSYQVHGFFVVLKEFAPSAECDAYLKLYPDEIQDCNFQEEKFIPFLIGRGLLLEVPYGVFHLGDYSRLDEMRFTPAS